MGRTDKINHYLDIAQTWAQRGTCIRRNFGAVIVKNDEVIGSGYTGAPRGRKNCCDLDKCIRKDLNIMSGRNYEICRSVHAEQNAIIQARRQDMIDSTLYVTCLDYETGNIFPSSNPCEICRRIILNSGIKQVIVRDTQKDYRILNVNDWIEDDESLKFDVKKAGY